MYDKQTETITRWTLRADEYLEAIMASIKVRDFFNGRFFEIPKYQRGYAWDIQNVRDLFDDITESIESSSNH